MDRAISTDLPASAWLLASDSNCGVADSPATVGRKKGADSGFLGGWIGLGEG